jgi:hypothetical protein
VRWCVLAVVLVQAIACGADDSGAERVPCAPLDDLVIEYLAERDGGELLLVVRPDSDALEYEDIRLFYGPHEHVAEYPIDAFQRQRDGGTTHILFRVDGTDADAFFPVTFDGTQFADGPATLTLGGDTVELTLIASPIRGDDAAAAALEDAELECLR